MFKDELLKAKRGHAELEIPWDALACYLDALEFQAARDPERRAFSFHTERDPTNTLPHDLSFSGTLSLAGRFAEVMNRLGARPGDRIGLLLDTSPQFLAAYFGSMHAGLIPVCLAAPASPKNPVAAHHRIASILSDCGARFAAVEPLLLSLEAEFRKQIPSLEQVFAVDAVLQRAGADSSAVSPRHPAKAGDLALIQYTSGTTSAPRAVPVTHGALLGMIRALGDALWIHDGDVVVNWLPFFHDMGLIGYVLTTAAHGAQHHYLSPRQFVSDPLLWLRLIGRERASFSGGASFAYRLCIKALERDPSAAEGLDLSSLTRTICGGERIPAELARGFCTAFGPYGFHPDAFVPGYGLAENVLGVSYKRPGQPTRTLLLERTALEGAGEAVAGTARSIELVSVGHPIAGCAVTIAPSGAGPQQIGEIILDSEYAGAKREVRTGDLGFISEGELFIVGRVKELIIRAGENIAPEDIEEACASAPGLVLGPVIAVGVPSAATDTENIVVVAELRQAEGITEEEAGSRIAAEVLKRTGHPVHQVHFVDKGKIPRTSSGKLQRGLVRKMLIEAKLPR